MHLIHIDLERGWRGGQRQVSLLVRELAARGIRQTLLCRRGSRYERRVAQEAPEVHVIGAATRLRALFKLPPPRDRPAIYHAHSGNTVPLAVHGAWRHDGHSVVTRRLDLPVSSWLFRRAEHVVAISPAVREVLLDAGLEAARTEVIPSAVDLGREIDANESGPLRQELEIPATARVGLTVAALVDQKDPMTLVRALPHLPSDYVHVWVGPGELLREAELLAEYLEVTDRLRLVGFDPEPDRWFGIADVFVLPSVHEGLGTTVLDAFHFGVPVVSSDIRATAELVEDGVTGLRFPPGQPRSLAATMRRVLAEAELRSRLVAAARERVLAYDIRRTAERYLDLYRRLGEG